MKKLAITCAIIIAGGIILAIALTKPKTEVVMPAEQTPVIDISQAADKVSQPLIQKKAEIIEKKPVIITKKEVASNYSLQISTIGMGVNGVIQTYPDCAIHFNLAKDGKLTDDIGGIKSVSLVVKQDQGQVLLLPTDPSVTLYSVKRTAKGSDGLSFNYYAFDFDCPSQPNGPSGTFSYTAYSPELNISTSFKLLN